MVLSVWNVVTSFMDTIDFLGIALILEKTIFDQILCKRLKISNSNRSVQTGFEPNCRFQLLLKTTSFSQKLLSLNFFHHFFPFHVWLTRVFQLLNKCSWLHFFDDDFFRQHSLSSRRFFKDSTKKSLPRLDHISICIERKNDVRRTRVDILSNEEKKINHEKFNTHSMAKTLVGLSTFQRRSSNYINWIHSFACCARVSSVSKSPFLSKPHNFHSWMSFLKWQKEKLIL